VTAVEHKLLGDLFLMTLISFFGLALPGYALVRLIWPESDWNLGGSVSTTVIRPIDLVLVAVYTAYFVASWKNLVEGLATADLKVLTAGSVMGGAVFILILAAMAPAALFRRINLMEFFGLRWGRWKHIFWIGPCFVIGMMVVGVVMIQLGWQEWVKANYGGGSQRVVEMIRETQDMALLGAMVFSAVVVAPIAEEVIFRGFLYPVVKRYSEPWFAAIFTGCLFGVIHFNLMSFPLLALMGIVLVVLYEITGSLWVPIACHAAFNALQVGVMMLARLYEIPLAP
jgi:membrane protease YdiL (CAAX protease family)|tara:strand:+ start:443 stop:1294 length:852 start_codon:yes stop_codon:yes gene_type:complete